MKKILFIFIMISIFGCFSNDENTMKFSKTLDDNSSFDISVNYDSQKQALISGNIKIPKKNIDTDFKDVAASKDGNILKFSITRDIGNKEEYTIVVEIETLNDFLKNITYEINFYVGQTIIDASLEYLKKISENTVEFPDINLERVIRETIKKDYGVILKSEVETIKKIDGANKGISNISGLESLENLEELNLDNNNIKDISVLENLDKLKEIYIENNNLTTDNINKTIIKNLKNDETDIYYTQYITELKLTSSIENGAIVFNPIKLDQFSYEINDDENIQIFEVFNENNYSQETPSTMVRLLTDNDDEAMYFYAKTENFISEVIKVNNNFLLIESIESFEEIKVKVKYGMLELPLVLTVSLTNGEQRVVAVNWETESINLGLVGKYNVVGEIETAEEIQNPKGLKAFVSVNVYNEEVVEGFVITLSDPEIRYIKLGSEYETSIYSAIDSKLEDVTKLVEVKDNVDSKKEGEYEVSFEIKDDSTNGKIIVQKVIVDGTKPEIVLNGSENIELKYGVDIYNEEGFTASDNIVGSTEFYDLFEEVIVEGNVDNNKIGEYQLKYNLIDFADNEADEKIRTVLIKGKILSVDSFESIEVKSGTKVEDLVLENEVTVILEDNTSRSLKIDWDLENYDKNTLGVVTIIGNIIPTKDILVEDKDVSIEINIISENTPIIELDSELEVYLKLNELKEDVNITCKDYLGNDLTNDVIVEGTVDITTEGKYEVKYVVADSNLNYAEKIITYYIDDTKPTIELEGESTLNLKYGEEFIDPGVICRDNNSLKVSTATAISTVDTSALGTYQIKYNFSDNAGNEAEELIRTVIVIGEEGLNIKGYNEDDYDSFDFEYGDQIVLNETIEVEFENGDYGDVKVDWDISNINQEEVGNTQITGEFNLLNTQYTNSNNIIPKTNVNIMPLAIDESKTEIPFAEVYYGDDKSKIDFNKEVTVYLKDGTPKVLEMNWNTDEYDSTKEGKQNISGEIKSGGERIDLDGMNFNYSINVKEIRVDVTLNKNSLYADENDFIEISAIVVDVESGVELVEKTKELTYGYSKQESPLDIIGELSEKKFIINTVGKYLLIANYKLKSSGELVTAKKPVIFILDSYSARIEIGDNLFKLPENGKIETENYVTVSIPINWTPELNVNKLGTTTYTAYSKQTVGSATFELTVDAIPNFRGTPNNWIASPMTRNDDGNYEIVQEFRKIKNEEMRFKIDLSNDWTGENFPAADFIINNEGKYKIIFNSELKEIAVEKIAEIISKVNLTIDTQDNIYIENKQENLNYKLEAVYSNGKTLVVIENGRTINKNVFELYVAGENLKMSTYFNYNGKENFDVYVLLEGVQSNVITLEVKTAVDIYDSNLKASILRALGRSSGYIYEDELDGVTAINCSNVMDFRDIDLLKNLTKLTINGNKQIVYNYKSIFNLKKLKELYFNNILIEGNGILNEFFNVQTFSYALDLLDVLSINNGDISSLSRLGKLNVKKLYINYNSKPLRNINVFESGFTNLEYVNLQNNGMTEISEMNKNSKVKILDLTNNKLTQTALKSIYDIEENIEKVLYDTIMITKLEDTKTLAKDLGVTLPFDSLIIKNRTSIIYSSTGDISKFSDLYYLPKLNTIDIGGRYFNDTSEIINDFLNFKELDYIKGEYIERYLPLNSANRIKLENKGIEIIKG